MGDLSKLKEVCIRSCVDMYEQISAVQRGSIRGEETISTSIDEVVHIVRKPNYLVLTLTRKLRDTIGLGIHIDNKGNFFDEVDFDNYDEESMTICAYPSAELMELIMRTEDEHIQVVTDLKFLIDWTKKLYEEYGDILKYPQTTPSFSHDDYTFPRGSNPMEQQREAVHTILNSSMSYVWGAPGTGKTQYVLSTAVLAYLKKGGRVAVMAPTNNAVEQVLRGVLKVIEQDDPEHVYVDPKKDILRVGVSTAAFFKDYPDVCEKRTVDTQVKKLRDTNEVIVRLMYERRLDGLKPIFNEVDDLCERIRSGETGLKAEAMEKWKIIRTVIRENEKYAHLCDNVDEFNLGTEIRDIAYALMNRDRPELSITQYQDKTDDDLKNIIRENLNKLDELEAFTTESRLKTAKIVAMTPFKLMSGRKGMFERGNIFTMDHIFIDEIGYSNLIQTLPVFMSGRPVTMLGDHMQLPPVCEIDKEDIRVWYDRKDYMRYAYLWDMSALYCESLLRLEFDNVAKAYFEGKPPEFHETREIDLTLSHRFGENLGKILDRCVYKNGIKGCAKDPLLLICIDVKNDNGAKRLNLGEVDAIKDFIENSDMSVKDFAVLTPYRAQRDALKRVLPKKYENNVMTVHSSQGREWDTVIVSVCDNDTTNRDVKLRFTSSLPPYSGLNVINTAVSRAKRRLVIVCDYDFWKGRASLDDLIGVLVADDETVVL